MELEGCICVVITLIWNEIDNSCFIIDIVIKV